MIGIPQAGDRVPAAATVRGERTAQAPATRPLNPKQTMMGVATPGIAPLRPGEPPPLEPPPLLSGPAGAPVRPRTTPDATIVPPPEPLPEIAAPVPPTDMPKRGVPLATVALVLGVLVLVSGITVVLVLRGTAPISAGARSSSEGKDILLLHCDPRSCRDGTTAGVEGVQATFVSGEAEVTLPEPLHVGANPLSLRIDRPGIGRDEVVSVIVPVAYRISADVSPMSNPRAEIVVHVEALAGSEVTVDGKHVVLEPSGVGELAIDESSATRGPADESRVVAVDVGYRIVPPGAGTLPAQGTVSARVSVAPLRVDVPGEHAVFETDRFVLAGRAAKGASVTIDNAPVEVSADGSFESTVPLPAFGERSIQVRGQTPVFSPRTIDIHVKRVGSLATEAREFEHQPTLGYDAAMSDLAASIGQPMVIDGDVIESRTAGHRTVVLVDDRRGCAKGPCLVRVIIAGDASSARGKIIRAFGFITRPFSSSPGQTVPELEAAFVLPPKK
ncbi:MAG TPA: hypothetical protein VEK07_22620 [Polyangiaceae bacterium]|nr:hypothetical protein [Polyangiaceae bacterium]